MSEPLRLLQIEDSESAAALVVRSLTEAGYDVHSERVEEAESMRAALLAHAWDVIIGDYSMPHLEAAAALMVLRDSGYDIPFIVVSGATGEEHAVAMIKAGAHDYVAKNNLARLGPVVGREINEAAARRERVRAGQELEQAGRRLEDQQETLQRQTRSLEKTEALLREIHHRVKNNLQVVSSLLNLQSRAASNPEIAKLLEEIRDRIHSMALLHETLYESENLAVVNFAEYVGQLIDNLLQSCGVRRERIRLECDLRQVWLDLDVALPCGLIVNEVLSNAFKHAFPDGRTGQVHIQLKEHPPGTVSLLLADDGIGLGDVDVASSRSLGLRLVNVLARQLNAVLEVHSRNGTEFRLTFPINTGVTQPGVSVP